MKAHVVGICGVGMSATAVLLKEAGWEVSGSDAGCYGPPGKTLQNAGITPKIGYTPDNIPADTDLFVVGRNAKLAPSENAEMQAALLQGKPMRSFPEMIGELTKDRPVAVVAGSYGKSTTAAILAHILQHAKTGAGYFIGADPISLPAPALLGTGLFIAEGDEYPSSHEDSRAKFMHLHPNDVILTSVVHDHVNVYPTFADYEKPFRDLLALIPSDGILLVCAEEPGALLLANESGKSVVTYGVTDGTYHARDVVFGERTTFTLMQDGAMLTTLETELLGRHNVEDIIAASAYALARKLVTLEELSGAVASFTGVRRRMDRVTPKHAVPAYEGFGSSYEKARSAIEAMRLHFPDHNLVVAFEPHTFGWRNRSNLHWYDDAFGGAHVVFVAPLELQGKDTHDQLTQGEILERITASGIEALPYDPDSPDSIAKSLKPDEVVLILSSADFAGSLPAMIEALAN